MALQALRMLRFVVYGTAPRHGVVTLHADVEPVLERLMAIADERPRWSLRDVPGPSALGGGRRRALELLYVIAVNDFKKTYFGTVLGYLWSVARPLMQFAVLLAVFTHVFHFASKVPHYPVFLLFNIVLFGFFQEATMMAVRLDRRPRGGRPQDPVPAAGDPAGGGAARRCSTWC